MTRHYRIIAALAAFALAAAAHADMKTKTSSLSKPVTELQYGPTGLSDGVDGELNAAPAYGDLAHGPHGTFIKMPAVPIVQALAT